MDYIISQLDYFFDIFLKSSVLLAGFMDHLTPLVDIIARRKTNCIKYDVYHLLLSFLLGVLAIINSLNHLCSFLILLKID